MTSAIFALTSPCQGDTDNDHGARNARLDLDRAADRGGDRELAQWARVYGQSLCEVAERSAIEAKPDKRLSDLQEVLDTTLGDIDVEFAEVMTLLNELRGPVAHDTFEMIDRHAAKIRKALAENEEGAKAA